MAHAWEITSLSIFNSFFSISSLKERTNLFIILGNETTIIDSLSTRSELKKKKNFLTPHPPSLLRPRCSQQLINLKLIWNFFLLRHKLVSCPKVKLTISLIPSLFYYHIIRSSHFCRSSPPPPSPLLRKNIYIYTNNIYKKIIIFLK